MLQIAINLTKALICLNFLVLGNGVSIEGSRKKATDKKMDSHDCYTRLSSHDSWLDLRRTPGAVTMPGG